MEGLYHVPVLGQQVAKYLVGNKKGIYLDGTLGGGGHAQIILETLHKDSLYIGIDRDLDAVNEAKERLKSYNNLKIYCTTFNNIAEILQKEDLKDIDGVLLDLGVSSWQIDQDKRGFSFRPGLKLDMRMDTSQKLNAEWIVNNYEKEDLKRIFKEYGEERFAGKIAHLIVKHREQQQIKSSSDLLKIIDKCVNPRFAIKSYARIFQALRIEVNNELKILEDTLDEAVKYLKSKGRLLVITYHSLEDRIVKNFFREQEDPCTCPPELPVCVCGKQPVLKRLKPNFIEASQDEISRNARARSAKLRIAEKL
jgi:16S rRNA (cytosine1402-N4)-methyltransferase